MPFSRLDQRAVIYGPATDVRTDEGDVTKTHVRIPSAAADGAWWARFEPVAAGEESVAASPEMRVDGVVQIAAHALYAGGLASGGLVKILRPAERGGDVLLQVKGIKEARTFGQVMVDVARSEGDAPATAES